MSDQPSVPLGIDSSPTLAALAEALAKAQAGFTHPAKSRTVDVGQYRYAYAELPAVIDAVRPALVAQGLSILQPVEVRGTHVRVWTMLLHTSGEWLRAALVLEADSAKAQAIGSAITYGRRYGLSALLGIAADEDEDGALASSAPPPRQAAPPKPTPPTVPTEAHGGQGYVTHIESKEGTKNGKPWRSFMITFDDGRKGSTFDAKIADLAQVAHSEGWLMHRVLTPSPRNPKYNDLTQLAVVERQDAPDSDAPPPDDDDLPF